MAFNPDEYLSEQVDFNPAEHITPAPPESEFDPDAFLGVNQLQQSAPIAQPIAPQTVATEARSTVQQSAPQPAEIHSQQFDPDAFLGERETVQQAPVVDQQKPSFLDRATRVAEFVNPRTALSSITEKAIGREGIGKQISESFGRRLAAAGSQIPVMVSESSKLTSNLMNELGKKVGVPEGVRNAIGTYSRVAGPQALTGGLLEQAELATPEAFDALKKFGRKQIGKSQEGQQKFMSGKKLSEAWKEGDYESIGSDVATSIAFEAPNMALQIALALVSSGASVAFMGAQSAGAKRAQLDDEDPLVKRVLNPLATGAIEVATEKFIGTGRIADRIAAGEVKKGIAKRLMQIATDAVGGGVSEGAATFGENVIDKISGDDVDLREGVLMSSIVGSLMDAGVGTATGGVGADAGKGLSDAGIDAVARAAAAPAKGVSRSAEMRAQGQALTELSGGDEATAMRLVDELGGEMRDIVNESELKRGTVPSAEEIVTEIGPRAQQVLDLADQEQPISEPTPTEQAPPSPAVKPEPEMQAEAARPIISNEGVLSGSDGAPITVYHGTPESITAFDKRRIGESLPSSNLGTFFSPNRDVASDYALDQDGYVISANLSYNNMYEMSFADAFNLTDEQAIDLRSDLESRGYDGIFIKDMAAKDGLGLSEFVVFNPEQINIIDQTNPTEQVIDGPAEEAAPTSEQDDKVYTWRDEDKASGTIAGEKIGVRRMPFIDRSLRDLSDSELESALESREGSAAVLADKFFDDGMTAQEIRELGIAQDDFSAAELEMYRRSIYWQDAKDVASSIRALARTESMDDKVKLVLLMDHASEKGIGRAVSEEIEKLSSLSPDDAEMWDGIMETVKGVRESMSREDTKSAPELSAPLAQVAAPAPEVTEPIEPADSAQEVAVDEPVAQDEVYAESLEAAKQAEQERLDKRNLSQFATEEDARNVFAEVDRAREAIGEPAPETIAQWDAQAKAIYDQNPEASYLDVVSGDLDMSDPVNTRLAMIAMSNQAAQDVRSGDDTRIERAITAAYNIRKQGTRVAQALAARRDPSKTPQERMRSLIENMVIAPTENESAAMRTISDRRRMAVIRKQAKRAKAILAELEANGIDIANIDTADRKKLTNTLRIIQSKKSTIADKEMELWRNAILSAPTTHMANIVGNTFESVYQYMFLKPMQATLNQALGNSIPGATTFGDLGTIYKALFSSNAWHTGIRNAIDAYTNEQPVMEGTKVDSNGVAIGGRLGRGIRTAQRALLAMDEFAKGTIVTAEVAAKANQMGREQGLSGDSLDAFVQEQVNDTSSEAYGRALDEAKSQTHQEKTGAIASALKKIRQADGPVGWFGRHIFPFVDTPANIAKKGIRRTPLGAFALPNTIRKTMNGDVTSDVAMNRVAEQMLAWGVAALVKSIVDDRDEEGRPKWITGSSSPTGKRGERDFAYRNIPPQSIRIPGTDKWVSYSRIDPMATSLSTMVDLLSDDDRPLTQKSMQTITGLIRDKTFMSGLSDIMDMIEKGARGDGEEALADWSSNFAAGYVPNIIKTTLRAGDENVRQYMTEDPDNVWKDWLKKTGQKSFPHPSMMPPAKVDLFGRDVQKDPVIGSPKSDFVYRMLSPIQVASPDPIQNLDRWLVNYNKANDKEYWPTPPSATMPIRGEQIRLTEDQYHEFLRVRGEYIAKRTRFLDPQNTRESSKKRVQKIFTEATKQAKRDVQREL